MIIVKHSRTHRNQSSEELMAFETFAVVFKEETQVRLRYSTYSSQSGLQLVHGKSPVKEWIK